MLVAPVPTGKSHGMGMAASGTGPNAVGSLW